MREFRNAALLRVALLLCGLALPGLVWGVSSDRPTSQRERRSLARPPALPSDAEGVAAFPAAFADYFADQFGLREKLLDLSWKLHLAIGESPSEDVILGKDGWLFYAIAETEFPGRRPGLLDEAELAAWRTRQEEIAAWLGEKGIPYLYFLAPEKSTIHPEHLPRSRKPRARTRTDQMVENAPPGGMLDLRGLLRAAAETEQVYYRTDPHWNLTGANVVQEALARALAPHFPGLRPERLARERFEELPASRWPGALAAQLGGQRRERPLLRLLDAHSICPSEITATLGFSRVGNCLLPAPSCRRREIENPFGLGWQRGIPGAASFAVECPRAPVDATILVFRDSFFNELVPLFSRYFTRTVYVWDTARGDRLHYYTARVAPTFVIEEEAERRGTFRAAPTDRAGRSD